MHSTQMDALAGISANAPLPAGRARCFLRHRRCPNRRFGQSCRHGPSSCHHHHDLEPGILAKWPLGIRPGPKLSSRLKRLHRSLPIIMLTEAAADLADPFFVLGFGVISLDFGTGAATAYEWAVDIHEIAFDILLRLLIVHFISGGTIG